MHSLINELWRASGLLFFCITLINRLLFLFFISIFLFFDFYFQYEGIGGIDMADTIPAMLVYTSTVI